MNTISTDSSSAGATAVLAAVEEGTGEDGLSMTAEAATTDDSSSDGSTAIPTPQPTALPTPQPGDDDDDKPRPPLGLILGPIFGVLALAAIAGAYMLGKQNNDKAKVPTEESDLDDQVNPVGPSASDL